MPACDFCGDEFKASGKLYVKKDGKTFHFCSSKCEKNMIQLGKKPYKTKWVQKKKDEQ